MGTFHLMTKTELRARKKMTEEELTSFEQFKSFLTKLNKNYVGVYEFSKDEDHEKSRRLLRRAAAVLEIRIRVKEEDGALIFYRRDLS